MKGQSWQERRGHAVPAVPPGTPSLVPLTGVLALPASPHPGADEGQHDAFVEGQGLALLHLDAFLVQTLHGVPGGREYPRGPAAAHGRGATAAARPLCPSATMPRGHIAASSSHPRP